MAPPAQIKYWFALTRIAPFASATHRQLIEAFPDIESLFRAEVAALNGAGVPGEWHGRCRAVDWGAVERDLAWLRQSAQHALVTWDDPRYPPGLKQIADPPVAVFVHGDPAVLSQPQVAIVGSRNPTPIGTETAHDFARALAEMGFVITSGLAVGIDAAAHRGALAAHGKTVAVFGTGMGHVYPERHRRLAGEIVEQGGALVSEFPWETPARPAYFPQRNRIVSGLSVGVLVVEAALRSGSLITARYAAEQGREVFAIPGSIHSPLARGCHALIRQGAKLVETAGDILEELGALIGAAQEATRPRRPRGESDLKSDLNLDQEYRKLLECVGFEATAVDTLVARTGWTVAEISSMLLVLELQGVVRRVPGGYTCVPPKTKV